MIEVGSTFAGYRLEQLLSTDTVSMTFRAVRRRGPAQPVALRITHELRTQDGRPDAAVMARYIARLSEAVRVNHPALVPIMDAGEAGYRVWVATALIDGVTLTRYLRDEDRLDGDAAVALLWGLADGLDRAHAAGVVHGAISPRTIHVRRIGGDGEPTAVLHGVGIDSLLVRSVRRDRDAIDISDVAYVSPEYLRGIATDGRADQYAVACALHHCVTGRPPFVRDTATGLFGAHMFTTPPSAAGADGDTVIAGALTAGMAKAPEARHETCIDLLRATGHATAAARVWPGAGSGEARFAAAGRHALDRTRSGGPVAGAVPAIDLGGDGTPARTRPAGAAPANGRAADAAPLRRGRASRAPVRGRTAEAPPVEGRAAGVAPANARAAGGRRLRRGDAGDVLVRGRATARVAGPTADAGEPAPDASGRDAEDAADAPTRRESRILTWPVAAMLVLVGIISTMILAAVAREDGLAGLVGLVDTSGESADRPAAAADTGPASAGVGWQRALLDEPLYEIDVAGGSLIVTAPHRVATLDSATGATTWSRPIDVGVLTDMAATDSVVAVRAAKFRALAVADGSPLWEKPDIVAPISALTTAGTTLYGIGLGSLAPELVSLDAITGQEQWRYDGGVRGIDDDASVVASEDAVAVLDGETLSVLDPQAVGLGGDGVQARWQRPVEDPWLDSLALLPDAVVMADRTGDVCAYDPVDGTERWCERVPGLPDGVPTVVADRDVVVVIVGSTVTALALETGAQQWTFDAPRTLTPIAASSGAQVVVTDVAGRAHGLDLTRGFEAWRASGFGEVTALAATADAVYVGTRGGRIVRLQPPTDQPAS